MKSERRKARRRPVLESFLVSVVLPSQGFHRLKIHDLSEGGLRFDAEVEGQADTFVPIKQGEKLEIQLYLNQSLFLPIPIKVVRIENGEIVRRVGAEILETNSPEYKAYLQFIKLIDSIVDTGRLDLAATMSKV